MSRIKSNQQKLKISKNFLEKSPEMPSFSFRYLTTNKDYNFESLDKRKKLEFQSALAERMIEITQKSWLEWHNLDKKHGYEMIPSQQLRFSPNGYTFSDDEKVIVFRFNSQEGRIIGIKNSESAVYYVIGFDTDYSAYPHSH